MRKIMWLAGLAVAVAVPAGAIAADAPYYGPAKPWHGIGYKFGYKDEVTPDGNWRVVATVRGGEAVDMAMYRMAERARDAGYRYVTLLGGSETRSPGYNSATLLGHPSESAAQPTSCPGKHPTACYTADVALLLHKFGGPNGAQPGVALADEIDKYGRQVFYSGYGQGRAVPGASVPTPPTAIIGALPATAARAVGPDPDAAATERQKRAMDALRPVRGKEPKQGWTISD